MIFQIPDTMPDEHYRAINIHGFINLCLFVAFAVILINFAFLFIAKAKKQEIKSAKRIKLSFAIFGFFYALTRIFFILMFQDFTNPDQNYDLFASLAYSCGMIGFLSIIWALERIKYKKKYFFLIGLATTVITIICSGIIIVFIISGVGTTDLRENMLTIIFIGTPISALIIFILYISLIRMSTGIVRKKAIYSLLGLMIMFVGIVMDSQFFLAFEFIPLWIKMDLVPIIIIGGYLLFAITQL